MRTRHLAAITLALATGIAGCGDSDEPEGAQVPSSASAELGRQLTSIRERVDNGSAGACDDIFKPASEGGNVEVIDDTMASLPPDVDADVRAALEQSLDRLKQLIDEECAQVEPDDVTEPTTDPDPADTETTEETVPTETETTPTETTETTPESTETTPTTPPTEEPSEGRGPDGTGPPGLERGGAQAPDPEGDE